MKEKAAWAAQAAEIVAALRLPPEAQRPRASIADERLAMPDAISRTYVCLASGYAEPNILPALWQPDAFGRIVILRGTTGNPALDQAEAQLPTERYRVLFKNRLNASLIILDVPGLDAYATRAKLAESLPSDVQEVVLNVTGGPVPMKFGAAQAVEDWARASAGRAFRTVAYDPLPVPRLTEIAGQGDVQLPSFPGLAVLTIEDILLLRGHKVEESKQTAGWPELSRWLLEQVTVTRAPLHQLAVSVGLHRVADQAGAFDKSRDGRRYPRHVRFSELTDLNRALGDAVGKLWKRLNANFPSVRDIEMKDGTVSIASEEALAYLAGGWFEEATYCELAQALPAAEIAMNVVTTLDDPSRPPDRAVREMDVVIAWRDQLHAVECKTGNYKKKESKKDGIDGSTVDRLTALRRLIGPRGTVALAASRHADDATHSETVEDLRQRASRDSIAFWIGRECQGELLRLAERLRAVRG